MTTATTTEHTVPVECACSACRNYARANGLPFPMRALATPGAAASIPARNLVHAAYDKALAFAPVRPAIPADV